jgi:hypothetical protein
LLDHAARIGETMAGSAVTRALFLAIAATLLLGAAPPPRDYAVRAVPASAVTIDDQFWAPKIEINRTVTIPHILKENDATGRVANFEKAAGKKPGPYEGWRSCRIPACRHGSTR